MTQRGRGGWQKTRGAHTGGIMSEIHVVEQQERSEGWCSVYSPAGITGKVLYSGTPLINTVTNEPKTFGRITGAGSNFMT